MTELLLLSPPLLEQEPKRAIEIKRMPKKPNFAMRITNPNFYRLFILVNFSNHTIAF